MSRTTKTKTLTTLTLLDADVTPKKGRKGGKSSGTVSRAERYNPDIKEGLTSEQVGQRTEDGFVNEVSRKGGKSYLGIVLSNIFTYINILVMIVFAAMLTVVTWSDFSKFLFVVIIFANTCIGIIIECRSKHTIDKLKLVTAPTATVVRNGEMKNIPVNEVVLDDIMYLENGRQIATDSIVVDGEFDVNESMLTGESLPVHKQPGDMVFSGSFVTSGAGFVRADRVGDSNYIEKLSSHAKKYRKPKSEINSSITTIIIVVSFIMIPIAVMMVLFNYNSLVNDPMYIGVAPWTRGSGLWYDIIIRTSGAVIGMIPSGMFLLTSVALATSVLRLARKKTLVQNLYCIEMLARVDTLCLDKTGTITDGSMKVKKTIMLKGGPDSESVVGDIIGSMLTATQDNNQTAIALQREFGFNMKYVAETVIPFSSQRKMSVVTFENAGTYFLGAPEFVLGEMNPHMKQIVEENAMQGYRVLCLAHNSGSIRNDRIPSVRRPICFIVLEDHIRPEAYSTIKWFNENDVKVKIISGDNPITVSEVAKRVGVADADKFVSLDGMSNKEVVEAANKYTVFGRVSPEQKSILVKAMKQKGHTVAMTGDGVNDILAMRQADCAISIAGGTEAARNVAHLVLMDNNFNSMPDVVVEGRRVINNIAKSSSLFLMKTLMTIILSIISLVIGSLYFFSTDMLMMYEVFIIAIPSFFLALQTNKNRVSGRFTANVLRNCIPGGVTIAAALMGVYAYWLLAGGHLAAYTEFDTTLFTMFTITLTYTGYIILTKIAQPYNAYRIVLLILTLVLCACGTIIPTFYTLCGIDYTAINLTDILMMGCVILASYFVVSILYGLLDLIKLSPQSAGVTQVEIKEEPGSELVVIE